MQFDIQTLPHSDYFAMLHYTIIYVNIRKERNNISLIVNRITTLDLRVFNFEVSIAKCQK